MLHASGARRHASLTAVLSLAFAASALFSVVLTRDENSVAALWLANGILAAALLMLPSRWAAAALAACAVLSLTINFATGAPLRLAPAFTALNLAEAGLAAWLVRRTLGHRPRMGDLRQLLQLLGLAVIPACALTALPAGAIISTAGGGFWATSWSWALAHVLGMAVTLPAVLLLVHGRSCPDFRRSRAERAAIYGSVVALSIIAYLPATFPTPILLTPLLVIAAFRLGPRGAALTALTMSVVCTLVVTKGPVAKIATLWTPVERIHNLQLVIALGFMTSLSVALILAEPARIRRLLAMRTRAAKRAQARAQAAGAAKAEFLATMSHEIRTPMNSILGFTQTLIRRDDLPEEARRQLHLIDRAGASLLALVNDILDFSKLEAGEVELALRPHRPAQIAEESLAIIAPAAADKGLDVRLEVAGPAGAVAEVDEFRLRQILLNLLSNAVKFTEAGRVDLVLSIREQGEALLLRFEVRDTGVGIPRERMHRLFRRFSQVDSSVSRAYGGTGLGLAICKGLVEAMGGLIGVKSAPGAGSVFWFEITADAAAAEADSAPRGEAADLSGLRVLLVDDHPMNRDLGRTVLGLLGCEVAVAADGAEALELASRLTFDAILMDVHMPVMNGLEATVAIRALDGPAGGVPIIAMSADVLPEMVERCRRAGMNDAVGKPIQIEALHGALARWGGRDVRGRGQPAEAAA